MITTLTIVLAILGSLLAIGGTVYFTEFSDAIDAQTPAQRSSFDTPDLEAVRRAYEAIGEDATR